MFVLNRFLHLLVLCKDNEALRKVLPKVVESKISLSLFNDNLQVNI